jgi:hypothetical protein
LLQCLGDAVDRPVRDSGDACTGCRPAEHTAASARGWCHVQVLLVSPRSAQTCRLQGDRNPQAGQLVPCWRRSSRYVGARCRPVPWLHCWLHLWRRSTVGLTGQWCN